LFARTDNYLPTSQHCYHQARILGAVVSYLRENSCKTCSNPTYKPHTNWVIYILISILHQTCTQPVLTHAADVVAYIHTDRTNHATHTELFVWISTHSVSMIGYVLEILL